MVWQGCSRRTNVLTDGGNDLLARYQLLPVASRQLTQDARFPWRPNIYSALRSEGGATCTEKQYCVLQRCRCTSYHAKRIEQMQSFNAGLRSRFQSGSNENILSLEKSSKGILDFASAFTKRQAPRCFSRSIKFQRDNKDFN